LNKSLLLCSWLYNCRVGVIFLMEDGWEDWQKNRNTQLVKGAVVLLNRLIVNELGSVSNEGPEKMREELEGELFGLSVVV